MASAAATRQPASTRRILAIPDFRKLLATRLSGQFADGAFQASLAGTVLFNPERQAHAGDIAAGFAVLLLPYSVLGPFCGVLLDRWSRQQVLTRANLLRALLVLAVATVIATRTDGWALYLTALAVISVNRFVLSALSACLPHVVPRTRLITANAISTTSGATSTALGGGAAIGLRSATHGGDAGYAAVAVGAAAIYLLSSLFARRFGRDQLGPDDETRTHGESVRHVLGGLRAGALHIRQRPTVLHALAVIGVQRFAYGISAIMLLLLYRNYFVSDGFFRAGLSGLGQVVAAVAVGGALAAVATPAASRRFGYVRWSAALLLLAGLAEWALGLPFRLQTLLPAAAILGFVSQGVKICVDTLVAQRIADDFRGRVFTLYDTLFNVVFVSATVLTAVLLPENGRSTVAVLSVGACYVVLAGVYLWSHDPDRPDG